VNFRLKPRAKSHTANPHQFFSTESGTGLRWVGWTERGKLAGTVPRFTTQTQDHWQPPISTHPNSEEPLRTQKNRKKTLRCLHRDLLFFLIASEFSNERLLTGTGRSPLSFSVSIICFGFIADQITAHGRLKVQATRGKWEEGKKHTCEPDELPRLSVSLGTYMITPFGWITEEGATKSSFSY
jgi:hypothetical protein